MPHTSLNVLDENARIQVHEQSLEILARIGVRVDSASGRRILASAGAMVDENNQIVRFPRGVIEEALKTTPRSFSLGSRRPDWMHPLNLGAITLCADGGAVHVYESQTGIRRPGTRQDWLGATRLIDALEEIGVYWSMVQGWYPEDSTGEYVSYCCDIWRNFSKHVQDSTSRAEHTGWLLEILQVVFGDREAIRSKKPFSFLLCPSSPLVIEGFYTDAYLVTAGWNIPAVIMPMPLMGATAPANMFATLILANCEVLAMLCLVQAASSGTPCIYAPVPAVIDPRSGRYGGGVENALLGAAVTEMGRYYRLPVEASAGGSDQTVPGVQATYEQALNWVLPALSFPDILVGPGLLSGSTVLSMEQVLIDLEIHRRCLRLHRGFGSEAPLWLQEVIGQVGPAGNFLAQRTTRQALRSGEWYLDRLGWHETYEAWEAAGKPTLIEQAHDQVEKILREHTPLPLNEETERELQKIEQRARDV